MIRSKIREAYDKAGPEPGVQERVWLRLEQELSETAPTAKGHPVLRRAVLAAACIAMLAGLLTVGYAAYEKWRLPEPVPYTLDEENGNVSVHAESSYSLPTGETEDTQTEALSDEYFLRRAKEILAQAGIDSSEAESAAVRRQTHLYWNREEAEVRLPSEKGDVTVTFDAERGVFIGMSGIEWVLSDAAACNTQAEADALATHYYQSLPVEQGYVLMGCEKYDAQYWSYDFCREVAPGLYSWYECVRISINPVSGSLEGCTVFYVPLLDDHEEGELPLTGEEAVEIVRAKGFDTEHCNQLSVTRVVGLPNWMFSDRESKEPNLQSADVTRLCWQVKLDNSGEFADVTTVLVDYYTGEILGGDTTG